MGATAGTRRWKWSSRYTRKQAQYRWITFCSKQKQNISMDVRYNKLTNIVLNTVHCIKRNIIISCVRGGPGFLQDRKRLNVAIIRAKFSLVVVGCTETLQVK